MSREEMLKRRLNDVSSRKRSALTAQLNTLSDTLDMCHTAFDKVNQNSTGLCLTEKCFYQCAVYYISIYICVHMSRKRIKNRYSAFPLDFSRHKYFQTAQIT